jgi:hypothetical protein
MADYMRELKQKRWGLLSVTFGDFRLLLVRGCYYQLLSVAVCYYLLEACGMADYMRALKQKR